MTYDGMEPARGRIRSAMTEDELLTAITDAATYLGWRWVHYRRSDLAQQMGHSGFPDLLLVKDGRGLALELKSAAGKATPDQVEWLRQLDHVPGVSAYIVDPSMLDTVLGWL